MVSWYLKEMLSLFLKENSFQFYGKDYLHGAAMGTKTVVAFDNLLRPGSYVALLPCRIQFNLVWQKCDS